MSEVFVNKVAESGIITLDLEQYYPKDDIIALFDLKDYLFMGLILKEKEFREALKNTDWTQYQDKHVAVTCTADAIIPMWAYMLIAANLQPVSLTVIFGTTDQLKTQCLLSNINQLDITPYTDQRVVIKGCGEIPVGEAAYLTITHRLRPVVKSIMYGEPCSTVPIYKRK